jgi:uncharacterized tellurite resistance protein B-like protein
MSQRERAGHPLRDTLIATQASLQEALDEVCDDLSISESSTEELIRVEETLAYASDAAKQAISLRRRLDAEQQI